jgi:hypothetical protein
MRFENKLLDRKEGRKEGRKVKLKVKLKNGYKWLLNFD